MVSNINPYLVEGADLVLENRRKPLCSVAEISFGSMPNDGGYLLLSQEDKKSLSGAEPIAEKWLRPYLGSEEFINGIERWCLWLNGISPDELKKMPLVLQRVNGVKTTRIASKREATQELAATPTLFGENRQPTGSYLAIPKTSSERRQFIPIAFLKSGSIASTELFTLEHANLFAFGILCSTMHMAWVRSVCGRFKSDYRYSAGIVYNNYPWPKSPTEKQTQAVETPPKRCWMPAPSSPAHPWPTSTTRSPCRPNWSRLTKRWIAPWMPATANRNSIPTPSGWNTCSAYMKPIPACFRLREKPRSEEKKRDGL